MAGTLAEVIVKTKTMQKKGRSHQRGSERGEFSRSTTGQGASAGQRLIVGIRLNTNEKNDPRPTASSGRSPTFKSLKGKGEKRPGAQNTLFAPTEQGQMSQGPGILFPCILHDARD